MNCKPGDLAVVVRSAAGSHGKIVTCIRLATKDEIRYWNHAEDVGPVWFIDQMLNRAFVGGFGIGFPAPLASDYCLKPIRDNDGEDEMLRIAGKPNVADLRPKETA